MSHLTLALDAMGGDHGPSITVPAAVQALQSHPNLHIQLFGQEQKLSYALNQISLGDLEDRIQIVHAPDVVDMRDKPSYALRHRRESSMRLALNAVSDGAADACVSAGNTGALMSMAKFVLKTLPGIERPALVAALPTQVGKKVHMLDLGANINCDSETLFQFAQMGHVLVQQVEGIERPRVALLNIGEEETKGNDQIKQTAQLLQECDDIHFVGYIEGRDIFTGNVDVVVCDGFVGNVCLKTCEGVSEFIIKEFKQRFKPKGWMRLILPFVLPTLSRMMKGMNPDQYNGASLLGLRGIVVKSHGNADLKAFRHAIDEAVIEMERQVPKRIKDQLEAALLDKHS
ncbi:phosphate acyltransferase PlsX [Corallincola platygyrae]|uniref:Phosphate acyltransferase n=1 Tax=Corallincola platygyrae TaxID=1193278 RepID=A0ABW4XIK2_9GAMM